MSFQKINIVILSIFVMTACKNEKTIINDDLQKHSFAGTWKLLSRIDKDSNNNIINEPSLGSDPISILMYDTLGNMSVQIMNRNRKDSIVDSKSQNLNNLKPFNGYNAYFGTYKIDTVKKEITHIIEGSISPEDIGKQLHRNYLLAGDTLHLSFSTDNASIKVTRTLTFVRQKNM